MTVKELPQVRVVDRIDPDDDMPLLPEGKIAVFIGSHKQFSQKETEAIDSFCANHDAVVFCDHTSGYKGKFRQLDALLVVKKADCLHDIRLLIHLGNVSGDHFSMGPCAREVWRLSDDGLLRDRYGKLTRVFDMSDYRFFSTYAEMQKKPGTSFINQCKREYADVYSSIPELPFSNIWCAKQLSVRLPEHSAIHFGILTSLRSWNFFEIPFTINSACNVGGFGTDGMLSSLLGASFIHPNKLYFGVVGDLAFFYDMNALGNRHLGNNIRILLVNNGKGCEFTHYLNPGHIFKEDVNPYIAAAGHNGNQSETLVRDYAKNLGMDYFSAHSKDDFIHHIDAFVSPKVTKSCIFEVFTRDVDENEALKMITSTGTIDDVKTAIKDNVKNIVGEKGAKILKGLFKK